MSRQVQSVEQLPREQRRSPPAMRLLHVIASIRAAGGGPAEAVRSLSAVHQRDGHSVEVASLDDPADAGTIGEIDQRVEANLDGLRIAGPAAWPAIDTVIEDFHDKGELFVVGWMAVEQSDRSGFPGGRITLTAEVELPPDVHVYAPGVQGYKAIALVMDASPAADVGGVWHPERART